MIIAPATAGGINLRRDFGYKNKANRKTIGSHTLITTSMWTRVLATLIAELKFSTNRLSEKGKIVRESGKNCLKLNFCSALSPQKDGRRDGIFYENSKHLSVVPARNNKDTHIKIRRVCAD